MKNFVEITEVDKIAKCLESGGVVAIPTETVYGVASTLDNYRKIIDLKKRDNKPLAVLVSDLKTLKNIIKIPDKTLKIIDKFIPGELTVVGETVDEKYAINPGYTTTGVRIPNHNSLLNLLSILGPLIVSSANISGEKEALTVNEAYEIFGENVDLYVKNDQECSGLASTVLDAKTLEIYREGKLAKSISERIESCKK